MILNSHGAASKQARGRQADLQDLIARGQAPWSLPVSLSEGGLPVPPPNLKGSSRELLKACYYDSTIHDRAIGMRG